MQENEREREREREKDALRKRIHWFLSSVIHVSWDTKPCINHMTTDLTASQALSYFVRSIEVVTSMNHLPTKRSVVLLSALSSFNTQLISWTTKMAVSWSKTVQVCWWVWFFLASVSSDCAKVTVCLKLQSLALGSREVSTLFFNSSAAWSAGIEPQLYQREF